MIRSLFSAGTFLSVLSLVAFLWFVVGVWALLRSAEGDPPWRSTVALMGR
ncbi:MAG: hypothetical protein ACRDWI_19280 [Jiangellaceae bacterium]